MASSSQRADDQDDAVELHHVDGLGPQQLPTPERGPKLSETNETFAERVDVTTQPDGAFIGRLEIEIRPGDTGSQR